MERVWWPRQPATSQDDLFLVWPRLLIFLTKKTILPSSNMCRSETDLMKQVLRVKNIKTICYWREWISLLMFDTGLCGHWMPHSAFPEWARLGTENTRERHPEALFGTCPPFVTPSAGTPMCVPWRSHRLRNKLVFQKWLPTLGWGINKAARPRKEVWVAYHKRKPFRSDFPWCDCREPHFPSSSFWVWGDMQTEKASHLLQFYRCIYLFISSSCFW